MLKDVPDRLLDVAELLSREPVKDRREDIASAGVGDEAQESVVVKTTPVIIFSPIRDMRHTSKIYLVY